ncbi:protein ABHD15-like [Dendronephthya gigantea]|uniref:protein ABHD15-like n=1 Tax=Dendronephthya gigantea TaxID=151771 RepID=UPI00106D69EA|nr:protein ABHD15-like [Dendronephthya gigantea]XP_028400908.1 protein ABHD15-like [Dendronephthya gigantea]XP_028400909.1 protein ABHD15-like [Dendronephthya gigantea]XP_028400910.1 protein ABHD15-like [Dendronephthya gigantea]
MFCLILAIIVLAVILLLKLKYDNNGAEFKGEFYHKHCRLSQFLLSKWTSIAEPYRPTFWALNGNVQTLLHLLWPKAPIRWRREYLQLEDQGVVALDWILADNAGDYALNPASPVLVIIPGLTCGVHEVSPLCLQGQKCAFRCVVFNRRGHGGSVLTTACLQNLCEGKELDEVVSYIHCTFPCAKIVAVAYSTGASILLSYLEETRKSPLSGAVCISPSYEMDKGLDHSLPPIYDYIMTKRLVCLLRENPGLSGAIDYEPALRSSTMREFYERVYEPLMGMNGLRCSFEHQLNNNFNISRIRVPTLCISALDDPICSADCIPYSLFKNSSSFFLMTCKRGGHCGFYHGNGGASSWADKMACSFLDAMIHFNVRKAVENSGPSLFAQVTRDRSYTQ